MTPRPAPGQVGLWTGGLDGHSVRSAQHLVRRLDEQGWSSLWVSEASGREVFGNASLALCASTRMTVATGIANIHARDPLAMTAAAQTVADLYPGRFVHGMGVSHRWIVEKIRGGTYANPVATMRGYLTGMREAPHVPQRGPAPPLVLAALGPQMLTLAAEEAAGSLSYLTLPEHTATARALLGPDRTLTVEQAVTLAPSDEVFRARARTYLQMYTAMPAYRSSWLRQGFDKADFVRGGSPRLQDAMVVSGESAIAARVAEHLDAGADQVLLQIVGDVHRDIPVDDAARLAAVLLPGAPVPVPRQGDGLSLHGDEVTVAR